MRGAAMVCACSLAGCAANLSGVVYIDRNGDHMRQDDEPGVANAVVMIDHGTAVTHTDDHGHYYLEAAVGAEIVWVRVPAGFRPGPAWVHADGHADIGLVPLTPEQDAAP